MDNTKKSGENPPDKRKCAFFRDTDCEIHPRKPDFTLSGRSYDSQVCHTCLYAHTLPACLICKDEGVQEK
jgi:hypothetical protein